MLPSSPQKSIDASSILVLALVIALLAGAVWIWVTDSDNPSNTADTAVSDSRVTQRQPSKGQIAPNFSLENLEGHLVSLSDWQGRPVLINFWATWCGPCKVEMPAIQAAYTAHQESGFVVLAVAVDESAENVRRFFDDYDLTFHPLIDDGGAVADSYRIFGLPTSIFIGSDGIITSVHTGMLTESKMEEYLQQILSQG